MKPLSFLLGCACMYALTHFNTVEAGEEIELVTVEYHYETDVCMGGKTDLVRLSLDDVNQLLGDE